MWFFCNFYLKLYKIIYNRYRNRFGEIDIIALKNKTLIFVEVKGRKNHNDNNELVTRKQIERESDLLQHETTK
ncbi:MAG: hypothetical protein EOO85_15395 [Pedobacter sp.]|nr:MAG: hypothetical protein EOO85_15395 [Pedobacter sp.]